MNWQTSGGPQDDPFVGVEADIRAMVASSWWRSAAPHQRAEQITARLLAGPGEWWMFGAWGRWYRCGLDGHWHPTPPPADPAARRILAPAPPGVGNPPVPPQLHPTGSDLNVGRMASAGLLAPGPSAEIVARVQQVLINATAVDPRMFLLQDPSFQPGTPSTVAAAWGAILFCAGSPVVLTKHPLVEMFAPYLTVPVEQLRWMVPPDVSRLASYYTDRLAAGDAVGAGYVVRLMGDVATALQADEAFRPGASALAAVCAATLQMVQNDLAAVRQGPQTVIKEWLRRCPAEYAAPIVREAAPGEYLRLVLYDLAEIVAGLSGGIGRHTDVRRAAVAVMAADLQTAPQAVPALLPWLDPDSARTLQEVLGQPHHPLRELFPQGVRLPEKLHSTDAVQVRALLATTHALCLTWCRLAQVRPVAMEFIVPAACAAELGTPALQKPKSTGELTAWQIIEAARKHLADEMTAGQPAPEPVAEPAPQPPAPEPVPEPAAEQQGPPPYQEPASPPPFADLPPTFSPRPPGPFDDPFATRAPSPAEDPYATPRPGPHNNPHNDPFATRASDAIPQRHDDPFATRAANPQPGPGLDDPFATRPSPGRLHNPPPAEAWSPSPLAPEPWSPPPEGWSPGPPTAQVPEPPASEALIVEAYRIKFLCGDDDVSRLLAEVRRRGKWAQQLRGQEVSSASAPAVLLVGAASTGQRRLARMVARALAEVGFSSDQVRSLHAEQVRERGPEGLAALLNEHAGSTLLMEGIDELILDDLQGEAYARAFYRVRAEGVTDTTLVAGCHPARFTELSTSHPELITDYRTVRLPDLEHGPNRLALFKLLAEERYVGLTPEALAVAGRDLGALSGRGRLVNARLVEAYLDRACTRHLGQAGSTQAIIGDRGFTVTGADLEGVAAELPH